MITQIIKPGDKVEIKNLQQAQKGETRQPDNSLYKSQVLDLTENGNIVIMMPMENGQLVLLALGARLELNFYSKGGLYRAIGQVRERYKQDNVYMLVMELKSQLEKFQRREYYRFPCVLDIDYYMLADEYLQYETAENIYVRICQDDGKEREYAGQILDLSGGGIKFRAEEKAEADQLLLLRMYLKSERIDKQYYILGRVVACARSEKANGRFYEVRVKFLIQDDKVREEIIRYIFEEERRLRQKD